MATPDNLYGSIQIRGARENNLKNVSLDIPKRKITVFTGVSGSGKSSLVFGTIAAESQRLINETFSAFVQNFLPKLGQPDADLLANLSAAIVVDQQRMGGNSRSTVGTFTDAYTMLRLIFSRVGQPHRGHAGYFSFNNPLGMCPECEGLGQVSKIDLNAFIDYELSLKEGPFRFPSFAAGSWYNNIYIGSGYFDPDKKIKDFTPEEMNKLLYLPEAKVQLTGEFSTYKATYEGLIPKFKRLYITKESENMVSHFRAAFEKIVVRAECPKCGGSRLNEETLNCRIGGKNIAECSDMQVSDLAPLIRSIHEPSIAPLIEALAERLEGLVTIGLGYLSLSRESNTLSGGESQRVKMVRHLGSSLTDVTYVFDEPSVGLHPHDVHRLNELLVQIRDKGNTVLIVEHEPEVIAIADHIVDMGPAAGRHGGEIVYQGNLAGLEASGTLTGKHMHRHQQVKKDVRPHKGYLQVENANLHNLRNVTVRVPRGVMTVVTGVAGSGKSTLIQQCLPKAYPEAVIIDQSLSRGSKRSNTATYTGILDSVRKAFASANKVNAALFSANSQGACPECQGLGLVYTDLAHMDPVASVCEACEGRRFTDEVLGYTLRGKNIGEVFQLSVAEAREFFTEKAILTPLQRLADVGLGYLTLGQPMNTLSGGERQRIKLAIELGNRSQIYILDEPTTGLHMNDVDNLISLFDRLVDNDSTVIVIEHDLDVISRADWIIDLGPGAGHDGGTVIFEGTPTALVEFGGSVTGEYLAKRG